MKIGILKKEGKKKSEKKTLHSAERERLKNFQHNFSIKFPSKTIKVSENSFLCHCLVYFEWQLRSVRENSRMKMMYEKFEIEISTAAEEKKNYFIVIFFRKSRFEKWYWKSEDLLCIMANDCFFGWFDDFDMENFDVKTRKKIFFD